MKTRLRIRSIAASRLLLALTVLASFAFVIAILIISRWNSSERNPQESLTLREALGGKGIVLGSRPGVDELAEFGCSVILEPTWVHCVQPDRSIPSIVRFPTIRALNFVGQTLGHELQALSKLPHLQRLSFIQCEFVDAPAFLGDLNSLRYLSITSSNLTNEHLQKVLSDLHSLTELDLSASNVSSLDFLAGMTELEVLRLGSTRMS